MANIDPKRIKKIDEFINTYSPSKNNSKNFPIKMQNESIGITVSPIKNDLIDDTDIDYLADNLYTLIKHDDFNNKVFKCLILDLSSVKHVSSMFLGILIRLNKKLSIMGKTLVLTNVNETIREIFKITKMDEIFHIVDNIEDALIEFDSNSNKEDTCL